MERVAEREEAVKKYLLGELGESEQEEIELRLLTEPQYLDELLLVEEDLADDFVFGALPQHERQKVVRHFLLTPERRQKLLYTEALKQYVAQQAAPAWGAGAASLPWRWPLSPARGKPLGELLGRLRRAWASSAGALQRWLTKLLDGRRDEPWERRLAEAHQSRALLESLMAGDWAGLRLLALLSAGPRSPRELAAQSGAGEAAASQVLARLVGAGAAEERNGVFYCTGEGAKILRKVETAAGVKITP